MPTREQSGKHLWERSLHIVPGIGEQLQDLRIHILNHIVEVAPGLLHVVELVGQELVAFLQCLVFFQCQGIDFAQRCQVFFRLFQACPLGVPIEILTRGIVSHQVFGGHAQLLYHPFLGFLDAHLRLAARNIGGMSAVGKLIQLHLRRMHGVFGLRKARGNVVFLSVHLVTMPRCLFRRLLHPRCDVPRPQLYGSRQLCLRPTLGHGLLVPRSSLPLILSLPAQTITAPAPLPGALLGGAQCQARLHVHGFRLCECRSGGVAGFGGGFIILSVVINPGKAVKRVLKLG